MADDQDQVKPLAPSTISHFQISDEGEATYKDRRSSRRIKCCGCAIALLLIISVTILVLVLTIFHFKEMKVCVNRITIVNGTTFSDDMKNNITIIADVSVNNPNAGSFKFGNVITTVYYDGTVIGEDIAPPDKAKGKRTLRMNVTVDIIPNKLLAVPRVSRDLSAGALNISSKTRMNGKVKLLITSREVMVYMNCTMHYNVLNQSMQDDESCSCNRRIY